MFKFDLFKIYIFMTYKRYLGYSGRSVARFSKAPESFRVRKAIFSLSVSKNGEVYTLETSCMKRTSLHL